MSATVAAGLRALTTLFVRCREFVASRARPRDETSVTCFAGGEACLRALWEGGLVGAFRWSSCGVVTDANDEFLRMIGYGREDLRAGRIDWRKATRLQSPAESGAGFVETEFTRKDGRRARLRLLFVGLDERDARGVAFAQDLGEAQELHRNAERLRTLESQAVGFAHEINQPLTAATAYLQAARRQATLGGGSRSDDQLAAMDRAGAQLCRAARLVGEWRELFAHDEQKPEEIALHELIRDAWETVRRDAGEAVHAELRLRAERDLVFGDRSQIEQLVIDFLRSAAEAASASRRPRLIVATSTSGGEIAVEIRDAGVAALASPVTRRSEPRAIVEAPCGRVWSEASDAGGAAFKLALPLAAEACG
ncbi:hypothetical protein IY145_08245 [Methylosinus sp. H3A]|uniref:hypothetical protein n=1 Tax=Methylosinus sp. H3A TaxID=2785786 RepID=UPI0018C26956|nr:hypothetical protein [Methylosinus sp. H3A]MBG0809367.1 hypothetical protein [Methylosinus sp. H3A]